MTFMKTTLFALTAMLMTIGGAFAMDYGNKSYDYGEKAAVERNGKPYAVRFYADWCGSCRQLDANLGPAKVDFGKKVNFVVLDITDAESTKAAMAKAERLGISHIAEENGKKTGRLILTDAEAKKVGLYTKSASSEELRKALADLVGDKS